MHPQPSAPPQMIESYVLRESYYVLGFRILSLELLFLFGSIIVYFGVDFVTEMIGFTVNGWIVLVTALPHLFNTVLLVSMILRWAGLTYVIRPKELIIKAGVFNSKSVSYDLSALQAVTLIQSLFGKLMNFGTIKLYNPILREDIYLTNIQNPGKYANILKRYDSGGIGFIPRGKGR